jgi:transposase
VVGLTLGEPPGETTHWTGRMMAKVAGISLRSVQRIWKAHRLAPYRASARGRALGRREEPDPGTRSHPAWAADEGRSARNVVDGTVLGRCMQRHRHQEFIRFLSAVEAAVPAGKLVHCILDAYGTHKHAKVLAWLERHRRWSFHFTPTSCSWLNAVETFFSRLTRQRLRRGSFPSLVALQEAINRFTAEHNREPRPFVWTADPDAIVEKVQRGYEKLARMGERRAV